jgi:hypothetical protein
MLCAYTSEPGVPRYAALKAEYVELEAAYSNLSKLHERLKCGNISEASALLERIRLEDGIPDMMKDNGAFGQSMDHTQSSVLATGSTNEHGWPQADFAVLPRQAMSLSSNQATQLAFNSQQTYPIDSSLSDEVDRCSNVVSSPTASSEDPDRDPVQTSANAQRDLSPHISVSHKVLLWPAVFRHIIDFGTAVAGSDLHCIRESGSLWLWQKEVPKHLEDLPYDFGLPCSTLDTEPAIFLNLTIWQVHEYSAAYFNTFNVSSPLLDLDTFMTGMEARLSQQGCRDDDPEGVLSCLVFALGQLAVGGVSDQPTSQHAGELSGIRGAAAEVPPGLGLFNEARRRIDTMDTHCHLQNVQILLLQATYFEASARHSDFWRSASAASMECIVLIKDKPIDWSSSYGDFVKRAYWICVLHERLFDLDLRVALTGVESLEDQVPLPHFHHSSHNEGQHSLHILGFGKTFTVPRRDDYAYHFTAMITLSRLIRRADSAIHGYEPTAGESEPLWQGSGSGVRVDALSSVLSPPNYSGPPLHLVQELLRQLDSWRDALPRRLQWSDNAGLGFTEGHLPATTPHTSYFGSLRDVGSSKIDHNVNIAVAQLRTRFYHASFLVHRPFVYKALHAPKLMTLGDRAKCVVAIHAACLWPLSLAPPRNRRHLVPHLFSWTQNFLAMLLILQMCRNDTYLSGICEEGGIAAKGIETSAGLMIGWLEDVKQADGIAEWSVRVLGPALYNGREVGRSY